jgi:peptide subunit release factor 1 (eRF1)
MIEITREHVARGKLLKACPEAGAPGWTSYRPPHEPPSFAELDVDAETAGRLDEIARDSDTGSVLFASADELTFIVPPFPIEAAVDYSELYARPLVELLQRPRTVAVLLVRRGGFSVGLFRGDAVADSKTGQRFVKNRHRKGGQSQRRFDRIREKQVHELFAKACAEAREKLESYEPEIEYVFFGGDRHTLQDFRKECTYFERFGDRVMSRVLLVAGDPRRESLDLAPREIWSSEVWRALRAEPRT